MKQKVQTCKKCGVEKPLTEFHQDLTRSSTGYRLRCKACVNKQRNLRRSGGRSVPLYRNKPAPKPQHSAELQAKAVKAATIRLIKSHRSEFEFHVARELASMKVREADTPRWLSAGAIDTYRYELDENAI